MIREKYLENGQKKKRMEKVIWKKVKQDKSDNKIRQWVKSHIKEAQSTPEVLYIDE